jgi:hypothetical protein
LKLKKLKDPIFPSLSSLLAGWLDPYTIFYLCFCIVQITGLGIAETYILFQETLCTTLMIPAARKMINASGKTVLGWVV